MIANFKKFKKGKKTKSAFFLIILGLLIIFLAVVFAVSNWKIQKKRAQLTVQINQLKKEIQILEENNQQLQAGISQGLTEISLEREARERFNLKKPGEEVVAVLPPKEPEKEPEQEKSFWQKALDPVRNLLSNWVKNIKFW